MRCAHISQELVQRDSAGHQVWKVRLNTLRANLQKLHFIIIDEISMVGADMLLHIHRRLQEIKDTNDENSSHFGNVSILAVGNLYQPVLQHHVFGQPSDAYARLHTIGNGSLWEEKFKLMELDEIMCQKDDKEFAMLLNCHLHKRRH